MPSIVILSTNTPPFAVMVPVVTVIAPDNANVLPSNVKLASPCIASAPVTVQIVLLVEPDNDVLPAPPDAHTNAPLPFV